MINTRFEEYKMRRNLKRNGKTFDFYGRQLDEFQAEVDHKKNVGRVKGLYHERNEYINLLTSDGAQLRNKKTPMILCLWKDFENSSIRMNSFTTINGIEYKVTGIVNIQNWNILADISLEVADSGTET